MSKDTGRDHMHTALDCIPCFVKQALESARFVTNGAAVHEQVVRQALRSTSELNFRQSPPAFAQELHRQLRSITGVDDPYRPAKDRFNQLALKMLPELAARVADADDPLNMALRVAIGGNAIDLGANPGMTEAEAREAVIGATDEPVQGNVTDFRNTIAASADILYLTDNAGEIVLDRLLIEHLPLERVTVAVRGGPVLNDATMIDAEAAGLRDLVDVIDNGSDAPGTILSDCSENFRSRYAAADIVIAKGQGNFETLSDEPRPTYFLFKVKCPLIGNYAGYPTGAHVVMREHEMPPRRQD